MKKLIGFAIAAVMAGSVFAAEYGWQKGVAQNTDRSAFFSKVSGFKTEADRANMSKNQLAEFYKGLGK